MTATPCPSCRLADKLGQRDQLCPIGQRLYSAMDAARETYCAVSARSTREASRVARDAYIVARRRFQGHARLGWCPEPEEAEATS